MSAQAIAAALKEVFKDGVVVDGPLDRSLVIVVDGAIYIVTVIDATVVPKEVPRTL